MKIKFLILVFIVIVKAEAQSSVLSIGDSLMAYGNYTKAIHLPETYSDQNEVFYKLAKAYQAIGNYDQALANYGHAVSRDPRPCPFKV
ncbi:tetratricopeptide repeat protein [Lacinutrix neustonica]|uniref:Tetratricopeptide repeat protein n=1 Tax=Lacinutrix neustonica TaxID=2980107 RepID=A0A9E8MTQ1_9FLAO|nr:tetratricopeptide repeat protein [Lacinutrix neustonica]WAC01327.1 tetratricopeptide repeat protein [Lacinutrix neustonica]